MIRLCEPFRGLLYIPYYLVHALGAYRVEGVEVRLETAPSPAESAVALLAGKVDVIWGGPMRVQYHYDRDPECGLVLFGEAVTRDPFLLVGGRPQPGFSLGDLVGLQLGTVREVPTPWLCLQEDLRRAGIDPEHLSRVTDRTMDENADALRHGSVDVIQVLEPFAETLIREGAGHIWYAAAHRGRTAYTSYCTTRGTFEAREDELKRMVRALYRTQRWLHTAHPREVSEAVSEWFPAIPLEILTGVAARYQSLGIWNEDPILSQQGFDRLKAGLLSGGWITRGASFEECVNTRLAERVVVENPPPLRR